mmetsp:Transcript_17542/g.33369  ORF Transcript_17542/g.33369 Transcript_17542/m.33369 type:complete len:210 (-) Transcript_17542:1239-1868(-)
MPSAVFFPGIGTGVAVVDLGTEISAFFILSISSASSLRFDFCAFASCTTNWNLSGRVKKNCDPLPNSDFTHIFPPCSLTKASDSGRPSPVPLYSRDEALSACSKTVNILSKCFSLIPIPVSSTQICRVFPSSTISEIIDTDPSFVNFRAFPARLKSTCVHLSLSASIRTDWHLFTSFTCLALYLMPLLRSTWCSSIFSTSLTASLKSNL